MSKHSPGPWTRHNEDLRGGKYWTVVRPGSEEPIDIHADDNGEADSALIAAAPDLFAALEIARNHIDAVMINSPNPKKRRNYQDALSIIERALSKAEGRQP